LTFVPSTHLVALKVVTSEGDAGAPKLVRHAHPIFPPPNISTTQRVFIPKIKDLFLNPLGEVYPLVVVHLEVEVDPLEEEDLVDEVEVDPWEEVMDLLATEDFLNASEVDQLGSP
jgi:hypothetical protein